MHSCTNKLGSAHMRSNVALGVPPEQSPNMTNLRAGTPEGEGGWSVVPSGKVNGVGGREVRRERIESGWWTGGSIWDRAGLCDVRRGMRVAVSSGTTGVGSVRIYPRHGTEN